MRLLIVFLLLLNIKFTYAQSIGESSGYKIPRFVSTKSDESNLRIGASEDYPIILTYKLKNIPLEIIDEYKKWRKIRDINNNQGWMHERLFQGNRYGIIQTPYNEPAQILNKPKGMLIGKIGKNNIVKIQKCFNSWCKISINNHSGWINEINIWGIYENENYNLPFYQPAINYYWKIITLLNK